MLDRQWYRLDNSAKIIPSMTNKLNTNVFRIYCSLDVVIEKETLQVAVQEALEEFPLFQYTMKSGLFWHYLERTNIKPIVEEESDYPCSKIDNGLLFRVSFYKKRINLEVYHVLADGNGALEFLKAIVSHYLDKVYDMLHVPVNTSSESEKASDDFAKFVKPTMKIKTNKNKKAYHFKYPKKDDINLDITEIHVSLKEIKEQAKKYGATITVFLAAKLIKSIAKCAKVRELARPIGITIPVDLRHIFDSRTARNFFYAICIQGKYAKEDSLEDIIAHLQKEIELNMKKENLQDLLNSYMLIEKFLFIRIVPSFLKDIILGIVAKIETSKETMTLSNVGIVHMPEDYEEHISHFGGMMSSNDIHLVTMSFKDELVMNFASHFKKSELEKTFVESLKSGGVVDIRIISNRTEE